MMNMERIKTTLENAGITKLAGGGDEVPADSAAGSAGEDRRRGEQPADAAAPESSSGGEAISGEISNIPGGPEGDSGKTVERSLYLMKVDNSGTILWSPVRRILTASDSPMRDALTELIKGPSAEEQKQGFISLIPKDTEILSAAIRGGTAYINFNEDFLFNTYGVEGYIGQRRQVVLTATEFINVKDVQILIDGKRVDYLGEGIWIGSPVNRDML